MTTSANCPWGIGATSESSSLGIGSSRVLFCLNRLLLSVDSVRSLARIHPFCTNVSLPSGRTSLIVACRSTSGVDDFRHTCTAPPPIAVAFPVSGADTYETPLPSGGCCQFHSHFEALLHRP